MSIYKKMLAGIMCVLVLLSAAACGAGQTEVADDFKYKSEISPEAAVGEVLFDSAASASGTDGQNGETSVYRNTDVKLIRRADLQVQTVEFEAAVAALEQLVSGLNGYFEQAELYSGGYYNQGGNRSGHYIVRIPAGMYDSFMTQIDGVGYLSRRSESTQDVGQEYFDVESRLETQRTKRERLQQLLRQARSMEDIIALENALADVEYQIEQYTSQLRRYDSLIGYATISVNIQQMQRITDDPGQQAGLFQRMKTGVVSSAGALVDGIQDALVWMSYNLFGLLALALLAAGGIFAGRKHIKSYTRKKRSNIDSADNKEEEPKE